MRRRSPKQLALPFPRGPGRPRGIHRDPHRTREPVPALHPVHLTLKLVESPQDSFRLPEVRRAVDGVLAALHARRADFRVIAYSIQHNHMHLMVEADGPASFASGVRALCIRLALRINRALGRKGALFLERHHRRVLPTPTEVHHAYRYVLLNRQRHLAQWGHPPPREPTLDEYSSADRFPGWREAVADPRPEEPSCVVPPRTWLASVGWRKRGLLSALAVPG